MQLTATDTENRKNHKMWYYPPWIYTKSTNFILVIITREQLSLRRPIVLRTMYGRCGIAAEPTCRLDAVAASLYTVTLRWRQQPLLRSRPSASNFGPSQFQPLHHSIPSNSSPPNLAILLIISH